MKKISFKDMTISADIWKGTFDVECRGFRRYGLHAEDLAELIYPAVDAQARITEAPTVVDLQQTPRTKAKLKENHGLLIAALRKQYGEVDESTEQMIYNALSWTADDVLQQERE